MNEIYRILTVARKLIENPENWLQSKLATDKFGTSISFLDCNASKFCATGALYVAGTKVVKNPKLRTEYFSYCSTMLSPNENLIDLNDDPKTKHSDILKLFETLP